MKEFKGTLGPWIVVDDDYHANNTDSGITVETSGSGITIAIIGPNYEAPAYRQDVLNANLIAAAPDLLEELQLTLGALKEICFTCGAARPESTIRRAEAAIAKALGETK